MAEFPNEQHDDQNEHPSAPLPISDDRYYGAPRVYDDDYPGGKIMDFFLGMIFYPVLVIAIGRLIYPHIHLPISSLLILFSAAIGITIWVIIFTFKIRHRFVGIGIISAAALFLLCGGPCSILLKGL